MEKSKERNWKAIEAIWQALRLVDNLDASLLKAFNDHFYEAHLSGIEKVAHYLRNQLFQLITNEPDTLDEFYQRFDSPGLRTGKPVAWFHDSTKEDFGFIPDRMNDMFFKRDLSLKEMVKRVRTLYAMCIEIEEDFERSK